MSKSRLDELSAREEPLIRSAAPYLRALSKAASGSRHAVILGNRDAHVLEVVGDDDEVLRVAAPGAHLAERVAGANGVASPLAEGGLVEVVGPEHLIRGLHGYTCIGVPILGASGEPVGSIGMSVGTIAAARRLRDVLVCAGHGIQAELVARRLQAGLAAARASDSGALDVLRQDIVQLHTAARLRFQQAGSAVASSRHRRAAELLGAAGRLLEHFSQVADVWRDLVAQEADAPGTWTLGEEVSEVRDLLQTEAAIRGLQLSISCSDEVLVCIDRGQLRRLLLSRTLDAMSSASPGSVVVLSVGESRTDGIGFVQLRTRVPGPEPPDLDGSGFYLQVEFPLAERVRRAHELAG